MDLMAESRMDLISTVYYIMLKSLFMLLVEEKYA